MEENRNQPNESYPSITNWYIKERKKIHDYHSYPHPSQCIEGITYLVHGLRFPLPCICPPFSASGPDSIRLWKFVNRLIMARHCWHRQLSTYANVSRLSARKRQWWGQEQKDSDQDDVQATQQDQFSVRTKRARCVSCSLIPSDVILRMPGCGTWHIGYGSWIQGTWRIPLRGILCHKGGEYDGFGSCIVGNYHLYMMYYIYNTLGERSKTQMTRGTDPAGNNSRLLPM